VGWIGWALAVATTLIVIVTMIEGARRGALPEGPGAILQEVVWGAIGVLFAVLAALIISKEPRNAVGWVMLIPAVGNAASALAASRLAALPGAPASLDPWLWLITWFDGWSWVVLIFPLFHLLQVFPTGRVLSRRWRWLLGLELGMLVLFVGLVAFSRRLGPLEGQWTVANPIGFIPEEFWDRWFGLPWTIGLLIVTFGGIASMVLRYRRGSAVEREQIKWLVYACALFVVVYSGSAVWADAQVPLALQLLFPLSVALIPVAITVAILRYRLFDIDVIIRRTLVYAVLTGLLTAVYLGSVVVLQGVFRDEQRSSLSVAGSTLLITALFTPLRRRIQTVIDRRLFRRRYNAQRVIEQFGGAAQHQANLEKLSADLLAIIEETIQPRFGRLWLRESN
jgi:hypothetical protein